MALASGLLACAPPARAGAQAMPGAGEVVRSAAANFRVTTFALGLEQPTGAAFLPDGQLLVAEQPGRLRRVSRAGEVSPPLAGVPPVAALDQAGLMDLCLAPDFHETRALYLCHAARRPGGFVARLARARLAADGSGLDLVQPLLDIPPVRAAALLGHCRLAIGPDSVLYLATGGPAAGFGPAGNAAPDNLTGTLLQLQPDSRGTTAHALLGRPGICPGIAAHGLGDVRGLAMQPATGSLWMIEASPAGGDTVKLLRPGTTASHPLLQDPLHARGPSVAPSGAAFYAGDAFPGWKGSLFLAALGGAGLVRLATDGDRVTEEERLLWGRIRLRNLLPGPEGFLYLLTGERRARVLHLEPAG